ncbi:hypothetical protein STANM309S_01092 [Streptomyces tanashiensis]
MRRRRRARGSEWSSVRRTWWCWGTTPRSGCDEFPGRGSLLGCSASLRPPHRRNSDGPVAQSAELHGLVRRFRHGGGPEPGAAVRPRGSGGAVLLGRGHGELAQPHRPPGAAGALDDYFTRDFARNIGARDHGPQQTRAPAWALAGRGVARLVGRGAAVPHAGVRPDPRRPRPSFTLSDTTFHFIDADPATALATAREAADGKDVRLGGGATTIRDSFDADLVDTLHVAVSPVKLGAGVKPGTRPTSCSTGSTAGDHAQPGRDGDAPPLLAEVTVRHRPQAVPVARLEPVGGPGRGRARRGRSRRRRRRPPRGRGPPCRRR